MALDPFLPSRRNTTITFRRICFVYKLTIRKPCLLTSNDDCQCVDLHSRPFFCRFVVRFTSSNSDLQHILTMSKKTNKQTRKRNRLRWFWSQVERTMCWTFTLFAKVQFFVCARLRPPQNYNERFSESLFLLSKGFLCRWCFALLHQDDLKSKMSSGVNLAINCETDEWELDPLIIASFFSASPASKYKMEEQKETNSSIRWIGKAFADYI